MTRGALRRELGGLRRLRWMWLGGVMMRVPLGYKPGRLNLRYVYLGDRFTRPGLCGVQCDPIRRPDRKCIVSTSMASALVIFVTGERAVVNRRRLRLYKSHRSGNGD